VRSQSPIATSTDGPATSEAEGDRTFRPITKKSGCRNRAPRFKSRGDASTASEQGVGKMLEMLPLPEDGGAKEQRWEIVWRLRARLSCECGMGRRCASGSVQVSPGAS
jgi:hypothetical protein